MSRPDATGRPCQNRRILVVDSHRIIRQALGLLLVKEASLELCGEAEDEVEALRQIELCRPDLVVADVVLKGGSSGLSLISAIKARYPEIRTLIWSMFEERALVELALRVGATGYLSKEESLEQMVEAIHQVLQDRTYLSPLMARTVMEQFSDGTPSLRAPIQALSKREREIFVLIGRGLTTQQIATELQVSPKTVDSHRERIKQKLELKNSTELMHRAAQWSLQKN